MKKETTDHLHNTEDENSYTPDFLNTLFNILELKDQDLQLAIEQQLHFSAKSYVRGYKFYNSLPPHKIQKELEKALHHIDKAEASLEKIFQSENFSNELVNSFYQEIKFHPSLSSLLPEIRNENHFGFNKTDAPTKIMKLLSVISNSIQYALKYSNFRSYKKSNTLNHWVISMERVLEPIIGHKFQQSRYHKTDKGGEYISKKEMGDSELLKLIIQPLDPNVTIAQIETAIKDTHQERHMQKNL